MKKIYLIIISIALILTITSCGGTSDGNIDNTNNIPVVDCSTGTVTQIESGDILVSDEAGTEVTIVNIDGVDKTVCVKVGSAHLAR